MLFESVLMDHHGKEGAKCTLIRETDRLLHDDMHLQGACGLACIMQAASTLHTGCTFSCSRGGIVRGSADCALDTYYKAAQRPKGLLHNCRDRAAKFLGHGQVRTMPEPYPARANSFMSLCIAEDKSGLMRLLSNKIQQLCGMCHISMPASGPQISDMIIP